MARVAAASGWLTSCVTFANKSWRILLGGDQKGKASRPPSRKSKGAKGNCREHCMLTEFDLENT